MTEDAFIAALLRLRPDAADAVAAARELASSMARGGLELGLEQVLLRRGEIDASSIAEACRAAGRPEPTAPPPADPEAERRAIQRVVVEGALGPEGLENLRSFKAWAAQRGVEIGMVELLERRGFLPAHTPAPALPAPPPCDPVAPSLPEPRVRSTTAARRRPTERHAVRGRTDSMRRPAQRTRTPIGLWIGVAGGGLAGVVVLVVALAGRAPRPPVIPPTATAQPPSGVAPGPRAEPRRSAEERRPDPLPVESWEPDQADDHGVAEAYDALARRVDDAIAREGFEEARRAIRTFQDGLPDGVRIRWARRLDELRARVDERSAARDPEPARPPEPEAARPPGPEPIRPPELGPPRDVDRARALGDGRSTAELQQLAQELAKRSEFEQAIQYQSIVVEREPTVAAYLNRALIYNYAANGFAAVRDLDRAEQIYRGQAAAYQPVALAQIFHLRSQCYTTILEFQAARADAHRFLELVPNEPTGWLLLGAACRLEGDLDQAIEWYRRSLEGGFRFGSLMDLGLCLLEKGRKAEALECFARIEREAQQVSHRRAAACGRAWALVDPTVTDEPDVSGALDIVDRDAPLEGGWTAYQLYMIASLLSMNGDHREAYRVFRYQFIGWSIVPQAGFHFARTCFALGYEDEGRRALRDAIRMRPGLAARLAPADAPAGLLADVPSGEPRGTIEEKRAQEQALETEALRLSQIEALERSYRFAEASGAYRAYAARASSAEVRERAEHDAARAAVLAGVMGRVVERSSRGELADVPIRVGEADARITGGDLGQAELRVGGGTARLPWAFLCVDDLGRLAESTDAEPAEWLALGEFYLRGGLEASAWTALARAARDPRSRPAVDRLVAAHRRMEIPEGGFLFHGGVFVTAQEKARLDDGLVLFRGEWVTPADRERILQGHQKVKGQWTRLTEDELRARGWEKVGDEWLTPDELAARKGLWADAIEVVTPHFVLRSDRGRTFLDELARLLEAAWPEYERFFGGRPGSDRKLVVLAFKDFEGYREYCRRIGRLEELGALGFAPSEDWTCCGYDRFGDVRQFLGTLVHEAAHLFFFLTYGRQPPSWLAEGTATWFEGFRRIGDRYEFGLPSDTRLTTLRNGLLNGPWDLESLFAGDAGQLIASNPEAAIEFYARCWGLVYFLSRSVDPAVREIFDAALDRARRGDPVDLPGLVGPSRRKAFDKALLDFLQHL